MKKIFVILFLIGLTPLFANSSLEFDGIDDYVQLSNVFNIGSSSLTVEAWVKIPVIGEGNLMSSERVGILFGNYGLGNANINFEVYSSGQTRYYWGNAEINEFGSKDLRDGAWHHLAFVRDKVNNKKIIYVDGVIDLESVGVGTDLNVSALHRIGNDNRSSGNPYFHGTIDEVRVWDIARSKSEIREYMCLDVSSESNLLAYYKMSDDSGTSLSDNSTNSHTGTLINMGNPNWVDDNLVLQGAGSELSPYEVNGLNQLYSLSQNTSSWGSYVEQEIDILAHATRYWDSGAGFTPIGNIMNTFTGQYDGKGHSVDSLYIYRKMDQGIGFFGGVSNGCEIANVNLNNCKVEAMGYSGILVGAGGDVSINNCSTSGFISGGTAVAGLIAYLDNGSIANSFSKAEVVGTETVGGLVGIFRGSINNCYSRGDVSGEETVGGFIASAAAGSHTDKCYASGQVIGDIEVGGFAAYVEPDIWEGEELVTPGAEITNSFWDIQTSNQLTSDGGTGKTTADMKTVSTFTSAGWDFEAESANGDDDIWDLDISGVNNDGYPFLSWENGAETSLETALPIELGSFTIDQSQGIVELNWETESETENLGFIIRKKKIEESEWQQVGDYLSHASLLGHGTSSTKHTYQFTDSDVQSGYTYIYQLGDVNYQGKIVWHESLEITLSQEDVEFALEFGLASAYPNPFNPCLYIQYVLDQDAQTNIGIFDLNGKLIANLENGFKEAGNYELTWQATDVASGLYLLKIIADEKTDLRKVSLLK
jgi:hypothetical protein